jgi:hypothetical protein
MSNTQLLLDPVNDLCRLAGFETGASNAREVSLLHTLREILGVSDKKPPSEIGNQMVQALEEHLTAWNSEMVLERGDVLSADQVKQILTMAWDLDDLCWIAKDRRYACIAIARIKGRCGFETYRKRVEPEIMRNFAQFLLARAGVRSPLA